MVSMLLAPKGASFIKSKAGMPCTGSSGASGKPSGCRAWKQGRGLRPAGHHTRLPQAQCWRTAGHRQGPATSMCSGTSMPRSPGSGPPGSQISWQTAGEPVRSQLPAQTYMDHCSLLGFGRPSQLVMAASVPTRPFKASPHAASRGVAVRCP